MDLMRRLVMLQTAPDGGGGDGGAGGGGGAERPEWLLEKFKSEEEQARAYAEAEKRMTQLQTQLDQERQQFAETVQSIQQTIPTQQEPVYDPNQDPLLMQYERAVNDGDARAQLAITMELNRRQLEQTLEAKQKPILEQVQNVSLQERNNAIMLATERVKREYGEAWDELAPKIGAVLQERPHWIPPGASVEAFATTLDEVAQLVISREEATTRAREETDRIAKLSAQGLTGSGSRSLTPEEASQEWDKVKGVQLGGYSGVIRG